MDHAFPAPRLTQYDDEVALLTISEIAFPGSLTRESWEPNGIYIWIQGDPTSIESRQRASRRHNCVLGVLRAWWDDAGELADERLAGLGPGTSRNRDGDQWISVPSIVVRHGDENELRVFARQARTGISASQHLKDALVIHGRVNRTSADHHLIHELAMLSFATEPQRTLRGRLPNGRKVRGADALLAIEAALGVPALVQQRFINSVNNLPPLEGGRHAAQRFSASMTLDDQRLFTADLMKRWVETYDENP